MQAGLIAHPTDDVLLALGSGKLDSTSAETVIAHLDTCPDCLKRATSLSGDDLLQRLRTARSRWPDTGAGNTPAERSTAQTPEPSATSSGARSAVPAELRENKDYEIVRELGRGGMGVVYLARHRLTKRLDVLKVVSRSLLDQSGAAQRFLNEIELASRLSHPNIMTAYSAFQAGDLLMFAVEYLEGEDLARVVKEQGPLPVVNACVYALQTAQGLKHAHEKGVIHRDIKPSNLLLKREGKKHTVKILDFGLAKAKREERVNTALTGSHMALGTPDYMAPEQAVDAATADIRADIYSLGCTLYYLLSGAPPFKGGSVYEVMHAHQAKSATPLDQVRKEVPAELTAVVAKMMAKDPARRYQTPAEVVSALMEFVKGPTKQEPKEESSKTNVLPPLPRKRVTRWPVLIGGIMAVVIGGLVGLWAAGVFSVKTPEGTLVVEVDVEDFEVFVDGEKATVKWAKGRKTAVIRLKPGTKTIEIRKDGLTFHSPGPVEIEEGKQRILRVKVVPLQKPDEPDPVLPPGYDLMGGFRFAHLGSERTLVFIADTDELLKRYHLRVFHLETGLPYAPPLDVGEPITARAFSADGTLVSSGSKSGVAQVWDAKTGKKRFPPLKHKDAVVHAPFSPDGKRIATASHDGTARVWDAESGKPITPPLVHTDCVLAVAFSPDGKRVITASQDKSAQVWDASTGKKFGQALVHNDAVRHASFSPDGKLVATGSDDGSARIWDAQSGKQVGQSIVHQARVNQAVFSPNGKLLLTASRDGTARTWDVQTGKAISPVLKHADWIPRALFSPDGSRVVTTSRDQTAQVWDAVTGKHIHSLPHESGIQNGAFSPRGDRIVTASGEFYRRGWDAVTGKQLHRAPVVVASFTLQINDEAPARHTFYSNGRLNLDNPKSDETWEVKGRTLTFRWKNKDAPGGVWVNECILSPDGRTFTGERRDLKHVYTGKQISGRDLTKWPPYKQ